MKREANKIGATVKHPAMRDTAGIGYIIIPNNIDYYEYISACFRNSSITIITDRGEFIKNVLVSKDTWQYLDFPKKTTEKGSALVWLNIASKNKPVVISVLNKKTDLNDKDLNSFDFTRVGEFTSVSVNGNGDTGTLTVTTDGETKKESKIIYKVLNKQNLGEFSLYVQGDINVESENDISFKIKNKLSLQFIDEEDTEKQTNISYELRNGFTYVDEFNNKISINEKGVEINDKNGNNIKTHENGIEATIGDSKIAAKKNVVGMSFKGKVIKIDDSGITIEANNEDIQINAGDNVIQMTESGINIDGGEKKVSIGGSKNVLYSLMPGLTTIQDVSQIGISKNITVGE